jgi:hypothetical protein
MHGRIQSYPKKRIASGLTFSNSQLSAVIFNRGMHTDAFFVAPCKSNLDKFSMWLNLWANSCSHTVETNICIQMRKLVVMDSPGKQSFRVLNSLR